MLSRRHLRIKVLHALYEYFQNPAIDHTKGLKRLLSSIEDINELFLYELKTLFDIQRIAEDEIDRRKNKKLPTNDDLDPSLRFVNNSFLVWLGGNLNFQKLVEQNNVSWGDDRDILKRIFKEFSESEEYIEYLAIPENNIKADKSVIKFLYGNYIVNDEAIHQIYEDWNIHWADDLDAAQMMVAKTIKRFDESFDENTRLPDLIKDQDDLDFAKALFSKVANMSDEYEDLIKDKAQHWEVERIAILDIILMKMAIAELVTFKEIPVKVSLNEYIELSKEYSTPKSGNFINGILDKLKADMMEKGEIRKIGRGLL